jgi:2-polyprenyl-6-methoxyphenol hydroxylase-like FAD-dependent oxidoreductase
MDRHPILIVGGGIAGLTAAIALRDKDFAVEVIERDPDWSVYGVGIIQQSNVVRAVAALGVLDDYLGAGFAFDHVQMFAPDGTPAARIPSPRLAEEYPAGIGISRPALHKVLGDRAKAAGATIRLGVTADRLVDRGAAVEAYFSDGRTGTYAIVIGADGLYSQTRDAILPDAARPHFTGQSVWRYNLPRLPEVTGLHIFAGRIGAGLVPLSETAMYLFLTTPEPGNPRMEREGMAAAMRERMRLAPPPVAALADQITVDDAVVYKPLEALFVDGAWHKGRIVLIGDAVHASTPHLGQGAGMAIEDSLVLAEELARRPDEPGQAFAAFEERRRERCRFIVDGSLSVGEFQLGRRESLDYPALTRKMFEVTAAPL